jgi:hypothetical protein
VNFANIIEFIECSEIVDVDVFTFCAISAKNVVVDARKQKIFFFVAIFAVNVVNQ